MINKKKKSESKSDDLMLEIWEACAKGQVIQWLDAGPYSNHMWDDVTIEPVFNRRFMEDAYGDCPIRVKLNRECARPYKDYKEFAEDLRTHGPGMNMRIPIFYDRRGVTFVDVSPEDCVTPVTMLVPFDRLFDEYSWDDGAVCGVMLEEEG